MFRIAICDDSERDLRLNLDMVNKWKDDNSDSEIVVDAFHNPNDLLESHTEDMYHLWILDIVMPERDGISPVSYTHLDVYKRQQQCIRMKKQNPYK